jgi:hypothetical protein
MLWTDETCTGFATREAIVTWAKEVLDFTRAKVMPESEGGPPAIDDRLAEACAALEALLVIVEQDDRDRQGRRNV